MIAMHSTLRIFFVMLLVLLCKIVVANTFTVTSNADGGAGSLRDAITQCVANGTTLRDSIIFQIADNSLPGRTITLLSPLPALSSNMVINGSSQSGNPIGVSNARVMLFLSTYNNNFDFLEVYDCTDVGIYGMAMISTYVVNNTIYKTNGISYVRCHNLQIGRPGAGNYIFGCTNSIVSNTNTYGFYVPADTSRQLTIQSNVIGLDMSGGFSNMYQSTIVTYMFYSVLIINTGDIIIGGDNPSEGNTITYNIEYAGYSFTGINFLIESYRNLDNGILKINNNKLGTRIDGTLDPDYPSVPVFIYITGALSDYIFQFNNNILQGQININSMGSYLTIQGNTFFAARINTLYDCAITVQQNTGGGIIGGDLPGQSNTFTNNYFDSIYYFEDNSYEASIRFDLQSSVTIRNNIMQCNSYHSSGTVYDGSYALSSQNAWVQIDSTGVNFVRGKATPNNRVDVYLDDDCLACEGNKYLGFTMSNADGTWQYKGSFNSTVVATCTTTGNGQTSVFSSPQIIDYYVKIKHPECGKKNGYIKGLQVTGGDNVKWHYLYKVNGKWRDSVVAATIDLINAGPGLYFFDAWIGKTCRSYFKQYQLDDNSPKIDTSQLKIQNPGCGQLNGSITNIFLSSYQDIKITWINGSGLTVGNQIDLTTVGPGKYKLIIMDTLAGCSDSTFFYSLGNLLGPFLNTTSMLIGDATCGGSNGFIKNITLQNAIGNVYIAWVDSTSKIVGNNIDLTGVAAGKYLLKFKDNSGCDTITTSYYIIKDTGTITFDTTHLIIRSTSCRGSDGSITDITATNGTAFTWFATVSGSVVGNNENIYGLPAGTYQLTLSNTLGCTASVNPVSIGSYSFLADTVEDVAIRDASCLLDNGSITINRFSRDPSLYSFKWMDSITSTLISTNISIADLSAGIYSLTATDTSGCSGIIFVANVPQIGKPAFDTHALKISGDTCNSGKGFVQYLLTRDSSRIDSLRSYTWAWYNNQQLVATSANALYSKPAGTYHAAITDQLNCTVSSNPFIISDEEIIPATPEVSDQYIPRNTTTKITVANLQQGVYELLNDDLPGSLSLASSNNGIFLTPVISADRSFYIRFTTGDCNSALSLINIKVFDSTILYIPAAFTPNNDGINDQFKITAQGRITKFLISVYNRWGSLVFSSTDINHSWNGTINGVSQSSGVFVYTINATTFDNKVISKRGTIMLLR